MQESKTARATSIESFIITITGPSASGKSYVTKQIINSQNELNGFFPLPFFKYTTRDPRASDIKARNEGGFVDNISVPELSADCDLVYRTYGQEYGLSTNFLNELLSQGKHPIVVINDVRAVEELKTLFPNRVFSLFLFRSIPDPNIHRMIASSRGNVERKESTERYDKAIAMFRMYIENITLFDRVILNVKDYDENNPKEIDYTKLQVTNALRGVLNGEILLNKKVDKMPRLFIISGNPSSGKDDVIRAVQKMGRLQSKILPKYTSRRSEADDGGEMICQLIPKRQIIEQLTQKYNARCKRIVEKYKLGYSEKFLQTSLTSYERTSKKDSFDDFSRVQWEILQSKEIKRQTKANTAFWKMVSKELSISGMSEEEILNKYFEINPEFTPEICELFKRKPSDDAVKLVSLNGEEYIVYWNHSNIVGYAFPIERIGLEMEKDRKHRVLVASLPQIFDLCRRKVGRESVIVIYAYSQVSKDEYTHNADTTIGKIKEQSWDDLIRYSENIVDFDNVIIYATKKMMESSGGQKEELIDQMFRLFRAYNKR